MIKLMGACLVFLAATWAGFFLARSYRERPRHIRQLRSALSLLETEIGYGTRPLIQACEQISLRVDGVIATIFRQCAENLKQMDGASTYECFRQAIEEQWPKTAMKKPEKQVFLQFSQTLGVSDRQDQLQHVAMAQANLDVEERKARDEQVQYEKMYRTVGILCGVFIIILLY
ncbi:stage III sporulation protein SpoIIIAB [Thermoflavimicrobium daqui]|jgi:stage III sporulation protein AB|uniref:Stage III sporulation protein AB n=1 Tax=Thermoflavimicrobium daqui TaxID=2137476 RepID=A0A364K8F4_9BACL|nr:stage III sporulation protein SpoIIIAB [Thermoflavimicrobium daqui]RAL26573.1 stage III sporulation protein AB [Thermoflavimicrobium daqui]